MLVLAANTSSECNASGDKCKLMGILGKTERCSSCIIYAQAQSLVERASLGIYPAQEDWTKQASVCFSTA